MQLTEHSSDGYPELVFPAGYWLECLHRQDRIQAAKELRLEWWTVDLYLAGMVIALPTSVILVTKTSNRPPPQFEDIPSRGIRQRKEAE